jgi:hypothetical protein
VMSQKMLRGIKERAERTASHHASQARRNDPAARAAAPAL